MVRHADLNQSSRLDLDFDHASRGSNPSHHLNQIAESRSSSSDESSAFSQTSSLDSTAEAEAVSQAFSEGTRDAGQQRQNKHHPNDMNGNRKNIQRESTYSTLDTCSSSRNGERTSKTLVKIKLWDPGESSAAPTVVTVAMDMIQSNQESGGVHNLSLRVGQQIQLYQQNSRESGRCADEGEAVDISWQPPPKQKKEVWQPPFRIPKSDKRRADSNGDLQINIPRPMSLEHHLSRTNIPQTEPSEPSIPSTAEEKSEPSDKSPAPVKGLEPFTIPTIISSTIVKRTPTEKVGLAFRKSTGTVVVEKIAPGSAFDGTALRPGYECLSINGHRLRSARRAAEIVGESGSRLTLLASNAPRPPGTMYTIISLNDYSGSMTPGKDNALGMNFKMNHGLLKLVKVDANSPIGSTSMKAGDYILAINGAVVGSISKSVELLSRSNDDIVILYFNMRQLRVSLVDKVIGDLWKKEWSGGYDECFVVQPGKGSSSPLTLRFKEEGMCELRDENSESPANHPLNSVVETLNHGIRCVLSAIREGVELETSEPSGEENETSTHGSGSLIGELGKLSEMYKEGLLDKDDFEAIKSKLLKS